MCDITLAQNEAFFKNKIFEPFKRGNWLIEFYITSKTDLSNFQ